MRRILTGLNQAGQSAVIDISEVTEVEVWKADLFQVPEWIQGTEKIMSFEPDPGWVKCWALETPPQAAEWTPPPGHDDASGAGRELHDAVTSGMHKTLTSEVVFIGDPIILITEAGETPLEAGDIVILRGVMHDWRNPGDTPARTAGVSWAIRQSGDGA